MSDPTTPTSGAAAPDPTVAAPSGSATPPPPPAAVVTDEVTARLTELGVEAEAIAAIKDLLGVTSVADLALVDEKDLVVTAGLKIIQARKLAAAFAPAAPSATDAAAFGAAFIDGILPSIPDDTSWLESLKTGGALKVNDNTYVSAIRAALASGIGLYEIPAKLVDEMEKFADTIEEPVKLEFYEIRDEVTRQSYGEIFSAIPGLNASYVTATRKKELFRRIDSFLWPALAGYADQLKVWYEGYLQATNNPSAFFRAMTPGIGGGISPVLMDVPDTGPLHDHADAVVDAINKVFAGTGVQIASALAVDALRIRKILDNPDVPAMIGANNRDLMLKKLGVAVSPTDPRLEKSLVRFVLAITRFKDQTPGLEEFEYLKALCMVGNTIPWDQLRAGGGHDGISGIGGRKISASRS